MVYLFTKCVEGQGLVVPSVAQDSCFLFGLSCYKLGRGPFQGMMCCLFFLLQSTLLVQAGDMSMLLAMSLPLTQKPWRK